MRIVKKGATSQSIYVEILDSTSSTGGRKTGLVFNTASLTAYYTRNGGSATAITLATLAAADSAWSSGGFKEVDATNTPGLYRLDVPDAAFATGAESVVITLKGASGMVQTSEEIQLTTLDLQAANGRVDANIVAYGTGLQPLLPIRNATAQGGGANSITLDASASATDGLYDPSIILIRSGTGTGQSRLIIQYTGSTKVAIVDRAWRTNPDNTSVFEIYPANSLSVNEGLAQGGGASTITLNAQASVTDNIYNGQLVILRGGTGSDQARIITGYVGSTRVATVGRVWDTAPDNTTTYMLVQTSMPKVDSSLRTTDVNSANLDTTVSSRAASTALYPLIRTGTAQSGSGSSIVLDAGASAVDNLYLGSLIVITGGTGAGQVRAVYAYTGSSKTAIVRPDWTTNPDNTSTFVIVPGWSTVAAMYPDSIDASVLEASAITEIQSGLATASGQTTIQNRLPATLVSGRIDASIGATQSNAISDAGVSPDMDAYHAKIWVVKEGSTTDHYAVIFFKNGQPVTSGITTPTIQVIKASDGTDLIASTALTEVNSLGIYKKDESTNNMSGGAIYFAKVTASIDGSTRTWLQQIGRDST